MADSLYRGVVVGIDGDGLPLVEIAELGVGYAFGPCENASGVTLALKDRVLCSSVSDVPEDIVVIGPLDASPDGGVGSIPVDGAAAVPSLRTLGVGAQQAAAGNHNHDDRYHTEAEADAMLALVKAQLQSTGLDVINGFGTLGDNTNFPGFAFTSADAPAGAAGSFVTNLGQGGGTEVADLMAVDPARLMRMAFQIRQTGPSATGRFYGYVTPFDAYKLSIIPNYYMYQPDTLTTLAAPLNPGDTTITLASAANWYGSAAKPAGSSTHFRSIIWWDYVDPGGKPWPPLTYSRLYSGVNYWADGGVVGNVITLAAPYAGPARAAGTQLSNGSSGGTFMYVTGTVNGAATTTWTQYGASVSGVVANGAAGSFANGWPPATAYCRIGWLLNRTSAGANDPQSRMAVAAVTFSAATAAQAVRLDQVPAPAAAVSLAGQRVVDSAAPLAAGDLTSKGYVDAVTPALHPGANFDVWYAGSKSSTGVATQLPVGWTAFWMTASTTVLQTIDAIRGSAMRLTQVAGGANRVQTAGADTFDLRPGSVVVFGAFMKASSVTDVALELHSTAAGTPDLFVPGTLNTSAVVTVGTAYRYFEVALVVPAGHTRGRLSLVSKTSGAHVLWVDEARSYARVSTEGIVPTGTPLPWLTAVAPAGYIFMGATYNTVDYPVLAAALGLSGGSTFVVPSVADKVLMGASGTRALGSSGGALSRQLTKANIPNLDLFATGADGGGTAENGGLAVAQGGTGGRFFHPVSVNPNGADPVAVDITPAYLAVNWIIKT